MRGGKQILYVGGTLPARSETFVYREILALREARINVAVASVHQSERGLGDPRIDALADEAIPVYGSGPVRLAMDAIEEWWAHPARTARTMATGVRDALLERDVEWKRRPKVLWQCLAGLALARRVRKQNVVHIHAHMAHVPTSIAMYCAKELGITFSFTGHAVDLFPLRSLLKVKLERAAFVACISEWHGEYYKNNADIGDEGLPVVRCGVDVGEFAPNGQKRHEGAARILAVGRLVPKKGFDVLIKAVHVLRKEGIDIECKIVGDGPQRETLEQLIDEMGIGACVQMGGARDNDVVRRLMEQCDLFVLPCRVDGSGDRDGIPVVLMEAMASGVCAVSGDLPTIRELIDDDINGLMVEPGNVGDLVAALRRVIADTGERERLAVAGRERVVTEFSTQVNIRRLMDAFGRVRGGFGDSAASDPRKPAVETGGSEKMAA